MTTKKRTARRKATPAKAKRRPAPKVKALAALSDPVLREDVTKRNHRDSLLQNAFAWSPFGLLAAQAAFWESLVGGARRNVAR